MEDFIVAMLNMIGGGGAGSITAGLLSQAPETWNPALYQLAVNVHEVAVKPLTSVVLAVMFTLELARNSTRIEADRDLGAKIVAGTMFKIALVFIAVQNAGLFIRMFNQVTQFLMQGASSQMSYEATGEGGQLGDLMRDQIRDAGVMGQAALFFLLVIPWLLSQLASPPEPSNSPTESMAVCAASGPYPRMAPTPRMPSQSQNNQKHPGKESS